MKTTRILVAAAGLAAAPWACGDDTSITGGTGEDGGTNGSTTTTTGTTTTGTASTDTTTETTSTATTTASPDCNGLGTGNFAEPCGSCLEQSCCQELEEWGGVGDVTQALIDCAGAQCSSECLDLPEVTCAVPAGAPSGGSCFSIGGADECNPVTQAPCNVAAGEACDLSQNGFSCFPPPNDVELCGACDPVNGPWCVAGATCVGACARYCCTDADCAPAGACDKATYELGGDVGVCVGNNGSGGGGQGGGGQGGGGQGGGGQGGAGGAGPTPCGVNGVCVDLPPAGWSGPVARFDGAGPLPSCNGDYAAQVYEGHGSLACGSHSCTACSCGAPLGGTCNSIAFDLSAYWGSTDCSTSFHHVVAPGLGCYDLVASIGAESVRVLTKYAANTTCGAASGGSPVIDAATWGSDVRICEAPVVSAGCAATELCAEQPPAPFDAAACIMKGDVQPCPAGSPYTQQFVYYTTYTDTRTCTSCGACTNPKFKKCSSSFHLFPWDGCSGQEYVATADGICHDIGGYQQWQSYMISPGSPEDGTGQCTLQGSSSPTGSCEPDGAAGQGAVTVCCTE